MYSLGDLPLVRADHEVSQGVLKDHTHDAYVHKCDVYG